MLDELRDAVIDGQVASARRLTEEAVKAGLPPDAIFSMALALAMDEVGRRMQRSEYYIPEVLVSAKAMKVASELLKPLIVRSGAPSSGGSVVIGTVKGDLHDIGKNLVVMMLEGAGCRVVDLGADVPAQAFVDAVREHHPQVLGMSALLTTTMMQMPRVLDALRAAQLRSSVKVMIGGAPVTHQFADEIGADAYGDDAASAVQLVREWVATAGGAVR